MNTTPATRDWNPRQDVTRHADTTANIHRTLAWFYGVLGVAIAAIFVLSGTHEWGVVTGVIALFGAVVAVHATLAIGARHRNDAAKVGSVIVGVLMLFGFPIGTIVGGYLIYNGAQEWPPRRSPQAGPAGVDLRDL